MASGGMIVTVAVTTWFLTGYQTLLRAAKPAVERAPFSRSRIFADEFRRLEAMNPDALAERLVGLLLANEVIRREKRRSIPLHLPEDVASGVDVMAERVGLYRPDTVLAVCLSSLLRANGK